MTYFYDFLLSAYTTKYKVDQNRYDKMLREKPIVSKYWVVFFHNVQFGKPSPSNVMSVKKVELLFHGTLVNSAEEHFSSLFNVKGQFLFLHFHFCTSYPFAFSSGTCLTSRGTFKRGSKSAGHMTALLEAESEQVHVMDGAVRPKILATGRDRPAFRHPQHTQKAFESLNQMRKYDVLSIYLQYTANVADGCGGSLVVEAFTHFWCPLPWNTAKSV